MGAARSWDIALGDFDGDGDLDAIVANMGITNMGSAIWINDGTGIFTASSQNLGYGTGLDVGDLDMDGDLDVLIVSWEDAGRVWLNNGGEFQDSRQVLGEAGGFDVALGDVDDDGDLDAWIAHELEDTVWLNDGTGHFRDSGQRMGTTYTAAAELVDVEGDGDLDAISAGWDEPGRVWLNDGTGSFSDSGQTLTSGEIHIHGMITGDVTGNGLPDVVLTGSPNELWLNEDGVFLDSNQPLTGWACDTAGLGDMDMDGDLDLYLAVGATSRIADAFWLNDGRGVFSERELNLSVMFSSGIGLGDIDGDGDLDAFVVHGELWQEDGGGIPNEVWLNTLR